MSGCIETQDNLEQARLFGGKPTWRAQHGHFPSAERGFEDLSLETDDEAFWSSISAFGGQYERCGAGMHFKLFKLLSLSDQWSPRGAFFGAMALPEVAMCLRLPLCEAHV